MTHRQALSFPCHDVATINSGPCSQCIVAYCPIMMLLSGHFNFTTLYYNKDTHNTPRASYPNGVIVDKDGFVYVSDGGNGRIQIF